MNFSKLFLSKKASNLPINIVIGLILLSLVIIFFYISAKDSVSTAGGGLSDFKLKTIIKNCEISSVNCNVVVCSDYVENKCNEVETSTWISFENYYNKCAKTGEYSSISPEDYDKLGCGVLYDKIKDALKEIKNNPDYRNSDGSKNYEELTPEEMLSKVEKFKSSSFYSSNKNQFENYASSKNIDVNLLFAILIKEDGYSKSFENAIRFECHKFNDGESILTFEMDCTIADGDSFSRVSEETNYTAFLKAYDKDALLAFKSSSYGFAQMLGENIVRFESSDNPKELLDKVKITSNQISYFFKFLEENGIISDIKNKNYQQIAKKYNGINYAQNNYDVDLESYYENLA
jgi:hypothetical protein